ncbi:hypothetical protein IAG44_28730 [Streptomyces roseirectus]|uniref:Uncharacterized protein n=1 Tax=Streptomyces roseirectus TaxID=2768066 RepID=A0A7H0IJQ9_9ACTN|nr:hypothetical protein [Streptomyces roseirectus]QNP73025.1 hypothetical protein IAG44_28730 [Streptomyces roseirectus]
MFNRPPTPRRGPTRAVSVVLGLLLAVATLWGCVMHPAEAEAETVRHLVAVAYAPQTPAKEHVCAVPGHNRCHGSSGVIARTTAPTPHPSPQALPARVDARPATIPTPAQADPAAPRPPDLHVLQVLRT